MFSSLSLLFISVILSFVAFLRQRVHFLGALLILELISILIATIIPLAHITRGQLCLAPFLVILTLSACEARLGLALLVFIVRTYGNDLIQSLSIHRP